MKIHKSAKVANSLFNTFSGNIQIDKFCFTGHNVSFLTGTHNYKLKNLQRMNDIPISGRDIHVKQGVWIGSNTTIIGPCVIGKNSVIAANSVVLKDVAEGVLVGGTCTRNQKNISK